MEDKKQPIVVKKIIQGHGHHGGSWKVAFADFATAMMAFFMVLWLVGQTDANKRGGIAEYFQNPSMVRGHSEAPTGSIGPGGAGMSLISFGTSIEVQKSDPTIIQKVRDGGMAYVSYEKLQEQKRLESLMKKLKEQVGQSEALKPFKDQLLLEVTPNGLRIQVVDKKDRPMFDSGSANLKYYTEVILQELAKTINAVPNKITISGHTDASPMSKRKGSYTNWELSSDRANAARRALIEGGLKEEKIGRVIGLGSTILFDKENPLSPINRRISIVIMKREVSDLVQQDDEMSAIPTELIQGTAGMDAVKDNLSLPLSTESLELQSNPRSSNIETNTDTKLGMDLKLHGLRDDDEKTGAIDKTNESLSDTKTRSNRSDPLPDSFRDPNEPRKKQARERKEPKSFIQLPPIIDPGLLPRSQ